MNGYAKAMIVERNRKKQGSHIKAPKGFDILLADAISQFKMDNDAILKLGQMTARREIAHAIVGSRVYYRKETLGRLFGNV